MKGYQKNGSAGALVARQSQHLPQLAAGRATPQGLAQIRDLMVGQRMAPVMGQLPAGYPEYNPYGYRTLTSGPMDISPNGGMMGYADGYARGGPPAPFNEILEQNRAEIAFLRQAMMSPLGGPVHRANYEHGISAYAAPISVMKGGILQSGAAAIPAASIVGFTASTTVADLNLSRLTDTMWVYCAVATSGILSDPEEAAKVIVTADINGGRVNNIFRAPLDAMIPNLMGNAAMIPVKVMVPSNAAVTFSLEVVNAAISAGADATVVFRLYSGSEEQWSHFVHAGR